jgi:hypothetical protein
MRAFVLVLAAACSFKADFDIPYDIPPLTIDGSSYGSSAPFSFYMDLSNDPETHVSGVSTVTLSSLSFSITSATGCFGFIDDVTIWISSTKSGTTLKRAVVATGSSPGCVDQISLTPTDVDLKPYLDEGAMVLATGSGVPPKDTLAFGGRVVLHASL